MSRNKRLTIEGVAKKAGVSRATVDRILNGRGGVREETVRKVRDVLERYDYSASTLDAVSRPRTRKIEAILSEGSNPYFIEIRQAISRAGARIRAVSLRERLFDPYAPDTLVERLRSVEAGTDVVIMIGVDNPEVAAQIDRLAARGVRVVTIISDVSLTDRNHHVGQNDFLAGKTAARLMVGAVGGRSGAVAILIGHLQFRHLLDRRAGFEQSIGADSRDLRVVHVPPYGSDASKFAQVFEDSVRGIEDLAGVYLCGGGQPEVFEAVRSIDRDVAFVAHEVTRTTRAGLRDGSLGVLVANDMEEVARRAIEVALADAPDSVTRCGIRIHVLENLPPEAEGASLRS